MHYWENVQLPSWIRGLTVHDFDFITKEVLAVGSVFAVNGNLKVSIVKLRKSRELCYQYFTVTNLAFLLGRRKRRVIFLRYFRFLALLH